MSQFEDMKRSSFHFPCFVVQARRPAEGGPVPEIPQETPRGAEADLEGLHRILQLREGECPLLPGSCSVWGTLMGCVAFLGEDWLNFRSEPCEFSGRPPQPFPLAVPQVPYSRDVCAQWAGWGRKALEDTLLPRRTLDGRTGNFVWDTFSHIVHQNSVGCEGTTPRQGFSLSRAQWSKELIPWRNRRCFCRSFLCSFPIENGHPVELVECLFLAPRELWSRVLGRQNAFLPSTAELNIRRSWGFVSFLLFLQGNIALVVRKTNVHFCALSVPTASTQADARLHHQEGVCPGASPPVGAAYPGR